jgi:hypothetical protein
MTPLLNFFKQKNPSGKPFRFHLAFQYHDPSLRRIVLYNNGKLTCSKLSLSVLNEHEVKFSFSLDSITPRLGILLNLDDFTDKTGASFTGNLLFAEIVCQDKTSKFVIKENKFVPTK